MSITPYVVGQWVRGDKFYGRDALIEEILQGNRNWLWLLGTRRIGKTSLLKQVEHLTLERPEWGYFPIFWDFQGSETPEELHLGFGDSLLDAEDRLAQIGIRLEQVESDDLFRSLGNLRRRLKSKQMRLLLLCDEVEELIKLQQIDPSLLGKLRRLMQSQEDIRSVLASTIRLWALSDERGDTSPFLHGFTPPLYIHNLADDEARALIRQANLSGESRPRIDDQATELIRMRCDNHPYLIQLLCKRYMDLGTLDEAVEQVAMDPMVSFFFSVDFEMLSDDERGILRLIGTHEASTSNSIQQQLTIVGDSLGGALHRLEHLGYIRRSPLGRYVLVNYFFMRWFRQRPIAGATPAAGATEVPAGEAPTLAYEVQLGEFDGRYVLEARVGRGATGVVYKAHDKLLRSDIAIKLLKPEYAENEEAVERLRREILLSRDIAHPNIVRIYHLGEYAGTKYLTMEWMAGPTLAEVIKKEAPIESMRAVELLRQLASALEAAHAHSVLHRDIKPQNILLDARGAPHITDFGLARLLGDPGMTRSGVFLGTPDYASPEQGRLESLDERSDIYALGVILFEMTTGRKPFNAETAHDVLKLHLEQPPPAPQNLNPGIPSAVSKIVLRCLEKDPARRYQTAAELGMALRAVR